MVATASPRRRRKRTRPTCFATDRAGHDLFVRLDESGIPKLVAMVDGLALTFFGRHSPAFVLVQTAVDWHAKELIDSESSGNPKVLALLCRALDLFRRGELKIEGRS